MTRGGGGDCSFCTLAASKILRSGGASQLLCNYPEGPGAFSVVDKSASPHFFPPLSLPTHTRSYTVAPLTSMCLQYGRSQSGSPRVSQHLGPTGHLRWECSPSPRGLMKFIRIPSSLHVSPGARAPYQSRGKI